ncbi:MAG: DUF4271 domain-containing protein [Chlorobi bacterium]|nr:DUF4271 domain-containing protein [Chlorobiota bacterium]
MTNVFIYQQKDTIRLDGLMGLQHGLEKPAILGIKRIPIKHLDLERIDSLEKERKEVGEEKVIQPTVAQIRYWQRRREESLLVDSSRTMKPRTDVKVIAETYIATNEIGLPSRSLVRNNYDWLTLLLLFALFLFATARKSYSKYLGHLFQSLVNYSTASRMFREKNFSFSHGAYRLEIYFYITFSIFVYQVLSYLKIGTAFQDFRLYIICLAGIVGYFVIKRLLYIMVGLVIRRVDETEEYFFNVRNYNRVLGMFLFPVTVIFMFSPFFKPQLLIVIGVVLVLLFYFMSLKRGILILLKKHFSILYLFLYLCTFELLPLLLIYKFVLG